MDKMQPADVAEMFAGFGEKTQAMISIARMVSERTVTLMPDECEGCAFKKYKPVEMCMLCPNFYELDKKGPAEEEVNAD
jgi:hypothetical protein